MEGLGNSGRIVCFLFVCLFRVIGCTVQEQ